MQIVYRDRGLDIPVKGSSTLQALRPDTKLSLSDLARILNQPHQLVAQRIKKLLASGLAEASPDPNDGRRTEYRLTEEGSSQWQILNEIMSEAGAVNQQLFDEIEVDLITSLDAAIDHLTDFGLHQRFRTSLPKPKPKP
jgi:DNA-binding MarR family transcriptional regulator